MTERPVPWWRRALTVALDGIRSGFGLFRRNVKAAAGTEVAPQAEVADERREVERDEIEAQEEESRVKPSSPQFEASAAEEPTVAEEFAAAKEPAAAVKSIPTEIEQPASVAARPAQEPAGEPPAPTVTEPEVLTAAVAAPEHAEHAAEETKPAESEAAGTDPAEAVESDPLEAAVVEVETVETAAAEAPEVAVEPPAAEEPTPAQPSDTTETVEPTFEPEAQTVEAEQAAGSEAGKEIPAVAKADPIDLEVQAAPEGATALEEVALPEESAAPKETAAPEEATVPDEASEPEPSQEPVPVVVDESESAPTPAAEAAPLAEPVSAAATTPTPEPTPAPQDAAPTLPFPEKPQRTTAEKVAAALKARGEDADQSPFSVIVNQVYDGPLDLLLDLIRKQDIDIYDIPIAKITAQFLAYVDQLRAGDMDVAGDFIYTAALLIHIKSRMLLPRASSGPDDTSEDPRRELVERLLEHERFKNAAQMLREKQMLEASTWTNPGIREFQEDAAAEPEIAADTTDLVRVFSDILERARNRPILNVEEDSVTVGQMIQFLARRLTMEDKPVALRRMLSHTKSERALIAMFLALLELVRLQAILLRQDRHFSEIFIKKHTGFDALMNQGLTSARDDWR